MNLSTNNNLTTLAALILTTTFPTQGMEVIPSIKRPTITIHLSIEHYKPFSVMYTGKKYYECLNEKYDIKASIQKQQEMPIIHIIATEVTSGKDWVHHNLEIIGRYELGEKYTDNKCIFLYKKFPHSIPIDLLYNRTTGESINLIIYEYPVIAIFTDNPESKLPFKEQLDQCIRNFIEQPTYMSCIDNHDEVLQQLIAAGLISHISYTDYIKTWRLEFSINGFTSIEKLLQIEPEEDYQEVCPETSCCICLEENPQLLRKIPCNNKHNYLICGKCLKNPSVKACPICQNTITK